MIAQDKINALTLRFKELEWDWLTSLPPHIKLALGRSHTNGEFDPTLLTHYGEFFLTLCGVKPCFLIANIDYPKFAFELIDKVLCHFLSELPGFEIFQAPHQRCLYIFTSRHHPKFPLIKDLMLKPRADRVPTDLLGKALGYPVPGGDCTFSYVDETTSQELGVNIVVFEYPARQGFEQNVRMHFERCATEFAKIGKVLSIVCQQ